MPSVNRERSQEWNKTLKYAKFLKQTQALYFYQFNFFNFRLSVAKPPSSICSTRKVCLPSRFSLIFLCGDSSNLCKAGFHSLISNLPSTYTLTASSHVKPNS